MSQQYYYAYAVTGFCSREIVFDEATKFDWPETIGGANATFQCPNNATVLRCCRIGGIWQDFDHGGCITGQIIYT